MSVVLYEHCVFHVKNTLGKFCLQWLLSNICLEFVQYGGSDLPYFFLLLFHVYECNVMAMLGVCCGSLSINLNILVHSLWNKCQATSKIWMLFLPLTDT